MKKLELVDFPLEGLALIEASAGTGKTYTLANLYVRYLIEKDYQVDQILVVTFTEAATQELKQRIRERIGELRHCLEQREKAAGFQSEDNLLNTLCEKIAQPQAALLRLRIAERQMDEAEIYTIHGFCQRMLQQHALALGTPLAQELSEDLQPLWRECTMDFWRREIMSLPEMELEFVWAHWADPAALLHTLQSLLQRQPQVVLPLYRSGASSYSDQTLEGLSHWRDNFMQAQVWMQGLQRATRQHIREVISLVADSGLKRLKEKLRWLDRIAEWADQDIALDVPRGSNHKNLLEYFLPDYLNEQCKKGAEPPVHAWFELLEQQVPFMPEGLDKQFLHAVYRQLSQEIQISKRARGVLGFDDLIQELAAALNGRLDRKAQSEFIARVRNRYAVALIDEFQDTDPAQYHIFYQLFASGQAGHAPGLVLIGDPKQAIYAFRGGDIATYLRAKQDVQDHDCGEVFTMATNWRSSPNMVAAVNSVFSLREAPFFHSDIPFVQVQAGKSEDGGFGPLPALSLRFVSAEGRAKQEIEQLLARDCADQISRLLAPEAEVQVRSQDIAILVRTAKDAECLKSVLSERGIRASFETRMRIFDSEEALGVYLLLAAIAEPGQSALLRQCLAHPMLAVSDEDLKAWTQHSSIQAELHGHLLGLKELWERAGVLAMIRESLVLLKVLKRWGQASVSPEQGRAAVRDDWERRLSNINQLAELLQDASRVERGPQALLRWLREKIQEEEAVNDENRMRLESDDKLVKIVTIHKSKGLEYPVVFLPFMYSGRAAKEAWFYDDKGRRGLDLMAQPETKALAEQERLEEDMRLLYVALTRARYRCYLGFSDYVGKSGALGLSDTAWGQLIFGSQQSGNKEQPITVALAALRERDPSLIEVVDIDSEVGSDQVCTIRNSEQEADHGKAGVKRMQRILQRDWKVQSFTGLLQESHYRSAEASPLKPDQTLQRLFASISPEPSRVLPEDGEGLPAHILDFPKGSRAGIFLHTLFESIDFQSGQLLSAQAGLNGPGAAYASVQEFIASQLASAALVEPERVAYWSERLHYWLQAALDTSLIPGLKLRSVSLEHCVPEMNFHFPVGRLSAECMDRLLRRYADQDVPEAVEFQTFEGHIKGAIDLVFAHEGQYYVLDYKSNYLGANLHDYDQTAMKMAMADHRYDLQYLLYTLAVHRYLKHRLGERYSYARDVGGVLYLFLRGLEVQSPEADGKSGVFFYKPPAELIEQLDQLMSIAGEERPCA